MHTVAMDYFDEKELLTAIKSSNNDAFEYLYRIYYPVFADIPFAL